jgi:hypothetical protein
MDGVALTVISRLKLMEIFCKEARIRRSLRANWIRMRRRFSASQGVIG